MTSKNFSFELVRYNYKDFSDEKFAQEFAFLENEMSIKGDIVSTMLKDYKKEIAKFNALKKLIDANDCPALLQSSIYPSLKSSTVCYTPHDLRLLAIEYIVNTYAKINHLYWVALFDKLNLTRLICTRVGISLCNKMEEQKLVKFEDALVKFGYATIDEEGVPYKEVNSFYMCADFNSKNVSEFLKEIVKPLNKEQVQAEFEVLKDKYNLKAFYEADGVKLGGDFSNICVNVVSMLYMITEKNNWLSALSKNHLMQNDNCNVLIKSQIPEELVHLFEQFYSK